MLVTFVFIDRDQRERLTKRKGAPHRLILVRPSTQLAADITFLLSTMVLILAL